MSSRFALALDSGAVTLPDAGDILFLRTPADRDLGDLDPTRVLFSHGLRPEVDAWLARGARDRAVEDAAAAVVTVARAKALTYALIHEAIGAVPAGAPIIIDGDKADGVESILKTCRNTFAVEDVYSKAHGKCFTFPAPKAAPDGWRLTESDVDGFQTVPGVFSADAVDPGSRLLADHLGGIGGRVGDLGAGWGYLSRQILTAEAVTALDLVEVEGLALACARQNVTDPRAAFHWADATTWTGGPYDWVIMNPPFHTGRKGEPALGQAFIAIAARTLAPTGRLRLVANRHLPYEATLRDHFAQVVVLADAQGYKVIEAQKPRRKGSR